MLNLEIVQKGTKWRARNWKLFRGTRVDTEDTTAQTKSGLLE